MNSQLCGLMCPCFGFDCFWTTSLVVCQTLAHAPTEDILRRGNKAFVSSQTAIATWYHLQPTSCVREATPATSRHLSIRMWPWAGKKIRPGRTALRPACVCTNFCLKRRKSKCHHQMGNEARPRRTVHKRPWFLGEDFGATLTQKHLINLSIVFPLTPCLHWPPFGRSVSSETIDMTYDLVAPGDRSPIKK